MATLTTNHGASIGVTFYINNRLMKKILIILVGILILASCSRVSGTYESEKISLVDQVEFVGNSSCIVTYFGMKLQAKYRIDNGHIFVDRIINSLSPFCIFRSIFGSFIFTKEAINSTCSIG